MHARHTVTAVVTGKPVALGGSLGRREATGRGVMFCVNEAIKRFDLSRSQPRSSFRDREMWAASVPQLMHEQGYKIVAISDVGGGIHNPNGLDIPEVLEYLQANVRSKVFRKRTKYRTMTFSKSNATCLPRVRPKIKSPRRMPTASNVRFSPKARTVRRRQRPIRFCTTRGFLLFPTFLQTPAVLPFRISNGSRTEWVISGPKTKLITDWKKRWSQVLTN